MAEPDSSKRSLDAGDDLRMSYTLYVHQDALLWSRLTVLLTIELAAIAAAYATHQDRPRLASLVLLLGTLLTAAIARLIHRDRQVRDYHSCRIEKIRSRALPEDLESSAFIPAPTHIRGQYVFDGLIVIVVAANLFMAGVFWERSDVIGQGRLPTVLPPPATKS